MRLLTIPVENATPQQLLLLVVDRLDQIEEKIMALSTQDADTVQKILNEVDGLDGKMDTIASAIPVLTQQLADAKAALDGMTAQDAADKAALDTAKASLDAATATVADFEAAADTIKAHVDAVDKHADGLITPQP